MKRFLKYCPYIYFCFELKYWSEGHGFKNLKSTQSDDACLVLNIISCSIVVHRLYYLRMLDSNITKSFWRKIFKHFSYTFNIALLHFKPLSMPQYWSGGYSFNNLNLQYLRMIFKHFPYIFI